MADPENDYLAEVGELGRTVGGKGHDDLQKETVDSLSKFVREVERDLDEQASDAGARKLLAFWDAFIERKLEAASEEFETIAGETIERFEQAFDADVIGIDLYQALETLAIVAEVPEEETDEERLSQWAARVHSLTEEFAAHLEGHQH